MNRAASAAAAAALVSLVFFAICYAEAIYSYGAGYFALLSFVILVGVALEFRTRRTAARKVVGGSAAIATAVAFGAFIASCINATRDDNAGTGWEAKAVLALVLTVSTGLLAFSNLVAAGNQGDEKDSAVIAMEFGGSGADASETSAASKCASCCKSFCWVVVAVLVILTSINTIMLTAEANTFEPAEEAFVEVDGHKIFTRCMGSGSPTVFFEHGLGGNSIDFSWVQRSLATDAGVRTCSYDRAGYGRSVERGNGLRISENLANETKQVLDALKIDKAIFIGHSFAGFNLRVLESRHPEMFQGIVFVDMVNPNNTAACDPNVETGSPLYQFGLAVAETGVLRILNLIGFLNGFAPVNKLPEDLVNEYKHNLYRVGYFRTRVDEYLNWGKNCDFVKKLDGEAKLLDVPVAVVVPKFGIHSEDLSYGQEIADLSPNGVYIQVDDEEADHVSVLFDKKYAQLTIDAAVDIITAVRASTP